MNRPHDPGAPARRDRLRSRAAVRRLATRRTGRRSAAAALAALALAFPAVALAYFLPVDFVLGKLGEHQARIADVLVEQDVHFYGDAVPGGRVSAVETFACKGAKARRTTKLPDGERVAVYGAAPAVRGPAAGASWADPPGIDVFIAMVCGRIGKKTLEAWGIDAGTRAYALYGSDVAYVLGAKPAEHERPQLWLDKDLFRPLRFTGKDGTREVRLVDYDSGRTGSLYPRVAAFLDRGKLVARFEVRTIVVNKGLAPADLD